MLYALKRLIIAFLFVAVQALGIPLEDIRDLDLTNPGYEDLNPLHGLLWNEGILENHGELLPEGNTLRNIILLLFHRTGTFDPSTQPDTNSVVPYLAPEVIGNINGALKSGRLEIDKIVKIPSGKDYAIPRKYRNNLGTWLNELRNDPKAYRVMLALLWYKAQSKKDFERYYEGARAFDREAVKDIPQGWLNARFTAKDAQLKQPPAIENYDAFLYWMMKHLSDAPPLEHQGISYLPERLADCGETSLKNFLKLAIDQNGTYNVSVLRSLGAKQNVIDFFMRFPNRQEQMTQTARNAWAQVTINLENVVYKQNSNGKKFEIRASTTNPSENMLAALRALFAKLKDVHQWEEVSQKIEEARTPMGLGKFQIEKTTLSPEGYGEVTFAVDRLGRFNWFFQAGHFYVATLAEEEVGKYPKTGVDDIAILYPPSAIPRDNDIWYLYGQLRRNERILSVIDLLEASKKLDASIFLALFNRLSTSDAKERVLTKTKFEELVLEVFAHKNFEPNEEYLYILLRAARFKLAIKLAAHKYFGKQGPFFVVHDTPMASAISAEFSQDGTKVLTASRDNTVRVWNAKTGVLILALKVEGTRMRSAAFSRDGKKILTALDDRTAQIWNAETGEVLRVLKGHTDMLNSAAFSHDGTKVVTSSNDKTARIWSVDTGKEIVVIKGHTNIVKSAVFTRDGAKVVTASADKTAQIWDAVTGKEISILKGHTDEVWSAVFSPDDARVLTASLDRTVRIWRGGKEIKVFKSAFQMPSAVFNPYGERVLAVSGDGKARIWSGTTGQEVRVLVGPSPINSAVYSPDNRSILTADRSGIARIWH